MTPDIMLELNRDCVRLLRRGQDGDMELGRVPLGEPDLGARMAAARDQVGDAPLDATIVLPSALVLFLEVGDADDAELDALIGDATTCPIEELIVGRSGALAAAVERTTLEEARNFASDHGFEAACFSARRDGDGGQVTFHLEPPPLTFRSHHPPAADGPPTAAAQAPASTAPATPAAIGAVQSLEKGLDKPSAVRDPVPALVTPPVVAARNEEEALTIFGARDRAPRSRGLTAIHAAAAVLALAVLVAAFGLFRAESGDVEIVGVEDDVETALDPIMEGQPDALQAVMASEPASEPSPTPAINEPAPRIEEEAVVLDAPRSGPPPAPPVPGEAAPPEVSELATLVRPPEPGVELPGSFSQPPPPGTVFDMDERGLVRPKEEGAPTPQGVLVYSGAPAVLPPDRSGEETAAEPEPQVAETGGDASLAAPQETPLETAPDIVRLRPPARPETGSSGIVVAAEPAGDETPRPLGRPSAVEEVAVASAGPVSTPDFDVLARQARAQAAAAAAELATTRAAEPPPEAPAGQANVAVQPSLPTRASVADRATLANAIRLERVNLIGVYGSPSDRRALIRLPTGRYIKVKVGDRVDGGRIAAIQASSLEYVKGGQRYALTMPNG